MRFLQAAEIDDWVRSELLDAERRRPIVALTTQAANGRYWIEPGALEERLGEWADVVAFETGEATWKLADALPDLLDVYGGAMRVWWPGLTRESNPYDHRLYLLRTGEEARRCADALERELRRWARAGERVERPELAPERPAATTPPARSEQVTVAVTSTAGEILVADAHGVPGRVVDADVPLEAVAVCIEAGQELVVSRPMDWDAERGAAPCSLLGLLPSPWSLVGKTLRNGDVVQGRVVAIKDRYALIEIVPGAKGIVGLSEVDPTFVNDIGDFLAIDELVAVQILELDAVAGRAQLSVKAARIAPRTPRPLPSLVPGGKPFEWPAYFARAGIALRTQPVEPDERAQRIEELEAELAAANEDRAALRRSLSELRRELRSLENRYEELDRSASSAMDALASARAFLRAVRVAHARAMDEGERQDHPLLAMRVGREFLASARDLQGISVEKIVEVAAQVACDRAHEIDGREVHPLAAGAGGARQRTRERDGAKAWRCALQINSASARRLHWWRIPGPDGATIEFASVAVHDDLGIPE